MGATSAGGAAGIVLGDPDNVIHAAQEHGPDDYTARCGAGPVLLVPGSFEPAAPNACPGCGRQDG